MPGGDAGGQTGEEAAARGLGAVEALAQEFSGRRVLVVAHCTLLRVSLNLAIGRTLHRIDNAVLNLAHHHVTEGWHLEYFNGKRMVAAAQG